MSQIPWSPEGEDALREDIRGSIAVTWICIILFLTMVVIGLFVRSVDAIAVLVCAVVLIAGATNLMEADKKRQELGWEECVVAGVRFPGSGMLANKPRQPSELTRWKRVPSRAVGSFDCECGAVHYVREMKWVPIVVYDRDADGKATTVTTDPHGGRWIFHCPCGVGHYMLAEPGE